MKLITRQDLANDSASRWAAQYQHRDGTWKSPFFDPSKIHTSLVALGQNPTPDQVDAVIGNESWTRLTCCHCKQPAPCVARVDVTGGEYVTDICENCVSNMAVLFFP